jgi:uncharacterized OB-fold protein
VTGQVHGIDHDDVEIGQEIELSIGENETEGERLIVFKPA